MTLDPALTAAIARIDVVGSGNTLLDRATGFLFTKDGHVLTAAHVVHEEATKKPYDAVLQLTFGTLTGAPHHTTAKLTKHVSLEYDWAVLACDAPLPACSPLRLDALRTTGYPVDWRTFGYPGTGADVGSPYSGTVEVAGSRLILFSKQAAANLGGKVSGISGGPCIVNGAVVGVIHTALLDDNKRVVEGRITAIPIELIEYGCDLVSIESSVGLPYEDEFAEAVQHAAPKLLSIAKQVELPHPESMGPDLARQVARAILRGGLRRTAEVLHLYRRSFVHWGDHLRELAESLWVREPAAEALGGIVDRPVMKRVAAINTAEQQSSEHYIRRAGYGRDAGCDAWLDDRIILENRAELQGQSLEEQLRRALKRKWDVDTDAEIRDMLQARSKNRKAPIFVVFYEPIPFRDVLEGLETTFPGICIVLLTGAPLLAAKRAELDNVLCIEPEITPDDEARAADDLKYATSLLGKTPQQGAAPRNE
jgi:hypothetical protein